MFSVYKYRSNMGGRRFRHSMSRLFQPIDSVAKPDPLDCTSSRLMRGTQTSISVQLSLHLRKPGEEIQREAIWLPTGC